MTTGNLTVEELASSMCDMMPVMSHTERHLSVELYNQLAAGKPIGVEELAGAFGAGATAVEALLSDGALKGLIYRDGDGLIAGFGGLATLETTHLMNIDGTRLWTWCAWDGLFIPQILRKSAVLESPCPQTGEMITIGVTPEGISSTDPTEAVMSFLLPESDMVADTAEVVISSFCHHIYFLKSPEAGATWVAEHPGTFVMSLADAYELGKSAISTQFGDALPE